MTRRQIQRAALDAEHKRLLLAYHRARGGERLAAYRALRKYMASLLAEARA